MKRHGFIFARGGSKGIPGKNIRPLLGKPLIAWAIEAGLDSGMLEDIIVSTDSERIADVARAYGGRVPFMRPPDLARDDSPEWLAWRHAVSWILENEGAFDTFVSLPATAPLREACDVSLCIEEFERSGCDLLLTCMPARRHPQFNMYRLDEQGYAKKYSDTGPTLTRRQDTSAVYDGTTMAYITRPDYIMSASGLWDGKVRAIVFPAEKAVDIDDEFDFEVAEMILRRRGGH